MPNMTRTLITNLADIPAFASEAEEQAWWNSHNLDASLFAGDEHGDGCDDLPPIRPGRRARVLVPLHITPPTLKKLRALAAEQGIGYRTLIERWIDAAVAEYDRCH